MSRIPFSRSDFVQTYLLIACLCAYTILTVVACDYYPGSRRTELPIRCSNNLKSIVVGLHNYHDANNRTLPPPCVFDERGEAIHSWRALILPFMNRQAAEKYDMDTPWYMPGNLAVMKELAEGEYMCPEYGRACFTSYLAVTGEDTAWPRTGRAMRDIPDGVSNTIFILEIYSANVLWTEPKDITYEEAIAFLCGERGEEFIGHELDGMRAVWAAFGDGTVERLTLPMDRTEAMKLLRVNDMKRSQEE